MFETVRGGLAAGTALLMLAAAPVAADELGQREYMSYCASCHGETGMGNGPIAEYLTIVPPNLTTLSQQNGGEFPYLRIFQVIDGRSGLGPHGGVMPVWGDTFMSHEIEGSTEYGAETIVRGRILSLVQYLESIQQ